MERDISFGKYAVNSDKKENEITVTISLGGQVYKSKKDEHLSIRATVWNADHSATIFGGQCLNNIASYLNGNPVFDKIYTWWINYHLKPVKELPETVKKEIEELLTTYSENEICMKASFHLKNGESIKKNHL